MNAAEHYCEAERLADRAWHYLYGDGANTELGAGMAQLATAHAAMAQAAATIDAAEAARTPRVLYTGGGR